MTYQHDKGTGFNVLCCAFIVNFLIITAFCHVIDMYVNDELLTLVLCNNKSHPEQHRHAHPRRFTRTPETPNNDLDAKSEKAHQNHNNKTLQFRKENLSLLDCTGWACHLSVIRSFHNKSFDILHVAM